MHSNAYEVGEAQLIHALWQALPAARRPPPPWRLQGERGGLPSVYAVDRLAAASTTVATMAVADLLAARTGRPAPTAVINRQHAAVSFRSERYLRGRGFALPQVWDPLAGDYAASDGFIRLHTNYAHHRAAVLQVLACRAVRQAVATAVASWAAEDLEQAVVSAGGAAAMMRTRSDFEHSPQGRAVFSAPLIATRSTHEQSAAASAYGAPQPGRPLQGLRVLDLTRVIAGPLCTRFLAAYGADVLRIDPPGFEEVPLLLPEVTPGKRCASLNLMQADDRERFERLVRAAHVVVHGYRGGALAKLGFDNQRLTELNPTLIIVSHNAYGHNGPWAERRGFDSLVQMSIGISARTAQALGQEEPGALPAQALDHATGYLLAATVVNALAAALEDGKVVHAALSLARTGKLLLDLGDDGDIRAEQLRGSQVDAYLEEAQTAFGAVDRVRCVGQLGEVMPHYDTPAGALGTAPAAFRM